MPDLPQRLRDLAEQISIHSCIANMEAAVLLLREAAAVIETQGQLRAALALAIRWADSTLADWDADRDSKVGKKLSALAGRLKHYAPDTDIIHAVSESTKAAALAAKEEA